MLFGNIITLPPLTFSLLLLYKSTCIEYSFFVKAPLSLTLKDCQSYLTYDILLLGFLSFLNCQIKLEKNYLLIRNILYEYF